MLFLINDTFYFRPDDGAIWHISDKHEKVNLTPTASRLLVVLIEDQGEVVTREEIFRKVWDNWGMEGSNHSLNHFVSQLRKIFNRFDLPKEIITTVPRIGFIFSGDITIVEYGQDITSENRKEISVDEKPTVRESINYLPLFFATILLLFSFYFYYHHNGGYLSFTPIKVGELNNCSIYYLNDNDTISNSLMLKIALPFIKENNISCGVKKTLFLRVDKNVFFNQPGKVYAGICNGDLNDLNTCTNMMDRAWRINEIDSNNK